MDKRERQKLYFFNFAVVAQILFLILCCSSYDQQRGMMVNGQTESPGNFFMNFLTIVSYDQSECSSGQVPTNPPEKIESFTPEECYRYPTRSILVRFISSTTAQYQIFNTMTCQGTILTDLNLDYSIAGCQNPFNLPKWFVIRFGKPQAPIIGSLPYLYYEKTSITSFCDVSSTDRYFSARVYLMPNRCTFSDYMGIAERGVDGTDTSIQTINDAANCAGSPITYDYSCPASPNPYKIGLAFKTKPYTRVTGTVTVLSYTAVRVLGLDFGFDQKANAYTTVMLNQQSTSTPYNDGYTYQASTNMVFTRLTAGFSGTLGFYVDGFDYVNNLIIAPLVTQTFTIPAYPMITTITPVTVTTNSITITYGSTGGFANGNTYAVSAIIQPSTTITFPGCSAATTCQLVGLPLGALVNVTVTVTNTGSSNTKSVMQQLVTPLSNFDFAFQPTYSAGNITFSYSNLGYGETTFITQVTDLVTSVNTPYNTKNMYQAFAVAPSVPTNYRVNATAINDGNTLQVIKTFNWLGNILLSNITITDITSISANFWCTINNLQSGFYEIPITSAGSLVVTGLSTQGPLKLTLNPNTQYTFSATVVQPTTFRKSQTLPFVFSSVSTMQITVAETIQKINALNQTYLQIRPTVQGGSRIITTIFASASTNFTNGVTFNTSTNSFIAPNLAIPSGPFNLTIRASQSDDQVTTPFTFRIYKFPSIDQINVTSGYEFANVSWTSSGGVPGTISYEVIIYNPSSTHPTPVSVCSGVATSCLITKLTSNTPYAIDIIVSSLQFDDYVKTSSIQTLRYPNNLTCFDNNGNNTIDCNGFGQCLNGTCLCDDNRVGIYCETPTTDSGNGTNVNPKPNAPEVVINNKNIFYEFVICEIREVDLDDQIVKVLDLSNQNWTQTNKTNQPTIKSDLLLENTWIYSSTNSTTHFNSINITFLQYQLKQPQTDVTNITETKVPITFANQLFYLDLGSIKYTIDIDQWKFDNRLNTLQLITNITQPQGQQGCGVSGDVDLNNILNNSTEFTSVVVGKDQIVVGKLINRAMMDDIPRKIGYRVQQYYNYEKDQQMISIYTLIPNFSDRATLDPQFDLLLNGDTVEECDSSSSKTWKIIVGCVVGGVGLVAIATGATIYHKKLSVMKIHDKKMKKILEKNKGLTL
ncbi:hypothetical protein DFA_03292 [Cavenderia fasciculata]|uniref:ComC supersandwich domain-containing protein n=1 Tax=Cavenderia fasciculata TaxID=261658 RepID=F4PH62_CACFS|nr:uncharacterized protein DFA_03292 [Cavenderia fasciculata]EGG25046.1 hypothetical protein DFA_03292 [Cavenderia fasciculata]|eukprot:XP_004362897.1 hypothetical protein DFA_03292 [Cavenderia fasciculata]